MADTERLGLIDQLTIIDRERIAAHLAAGKLPPESQVRALWRAYEAQDADLGALRHLLRLCQELRALMRAASTAPTNTQQADATRRADLQWRAIASYLEILALDERSPGAAVAGRLSTHAAEGVTAR